jgi:biotin carboxylase
MTTPSLVFIESNTTGTGRLFAKAASQCGYHPVLLVEKPERYPFLAQDCIDYVKCDTWSSAGLGDVLERLSEEIPIAGIYSSSEYFVETAAELANQFGFSGPNPAALQICRNKFTQRQRLRHAGFLKPAFERITFSQAASMALRQIPLPVIVKPTMGSGSMGVRLCCTIDEVIEHANMLLGCTVNERGMPLPAEVLVEEYMIGEEYSAEVFGGTVLGITRKHLSAEPFFTELGHDFPADLPEQIEKTVVAAVQRSLQALELLWGPVHVELRLTALGPIIIEINPRLAGGFIPKLVSLARGVDMITETMKLVVGLKPDLQPSCRRHASIRFLTPPKSGVLQGFKGLEEASEIRDVKDVQIYRTVGDRIEIKNDFRDRIGHVISCADRRTDAIQSAELAQSKIKVHICPD